MAKGAEAALALAERALARAGVAHALIGACARNLYAPPRYTRDLNFAVLPEPAAYARVREELRLAGFNRIHETRNPPDAALPSAALFADATSARIDLLLAHSPFEREAIARAVAIDFPSLGVSIPVIRVEDLIVYKVLAGRPHDLIDIQDVTRAQAQANTTIDWPHVERECALWDASEALRAARGA